MSGIWQDVRYGLRRLRQSPGFTLVAVLTLALGIGANTAIFSAVNSVLLRPLPYKDASRLINIWKGLGESGTWSSLSFPEISDLRTQSRAFDGIAVYQQTSMNLTGRGAAQTITVTSVSPGFFALMGTHVAVGRPFEPSEEAPGGRSVILSNSTWRSRFGADPHTIGKSITLNGEPFKIVGVLAPGFKFPTGVDATGVWRPLVLTPQERQDRGSGLYAVVAKLRRGVNLTQAQAELNTISAREAQTYPASEMGVVLSAVTLREMTTLGARQPLLMLLAAVGFVLLIACADVAGLLLARATGRGREMTIRAALGATRTRMIRQLFLESFLLTAAGCAAALLVATWGVDLLRGLAVPGADKIPPGGLSGTVLWFAFGVALLAGILSGLAPALHGSRADLNAALKGESAFSGSRFGSRRGGLLRRFFVIAEVALAVILLVSAGLLVNSFWRLTRVRTGYRLQHIISAQIDVPFGAGHAAVANASLQEILTRVRALSGAKHAALGSSALGEFPLTTVFDTKEHPIASIGSRPSAKLVFVSPDYFRTAGITILRGRSFEASDSENGRHVVIVNELLARKYWPSGDAIGKLIQAAPSPAWAQVVGITADTRDIDRSTPAQPQIYVPFRSFFPWLSIFPPGSFPVHLIVETSVPPDTLAGAIRSQIWAVSPDQPIAALTTIEHAVAVSEATPKTYAVLLGIFAGLGLLLAAVGIYSLISYMVSQRTQEIGLRVALGAQPADVLRMVVREAMASAGAGLVIGIGGALGATRLLQSRLFGVAPTDPATFAAVAVLFTAIALLACYLPARRAMRIDPARALRQE